jgi:hypothetical protein
MPEGLNAEVARHLHEKGIEESESRSIEILEIVEALILAIVTIATAWSGYQAAKWDGKNALYYGTASRERTKASKLATLGANQQLYDVTTFNTWLTAKAHGKTQLAAFLERRFSPEYALAFNAWIATDPFHNPHAPPGPIFMPEYHNSQLERSDALSATARVTFEQGTQARERADDYVRDTLLLASILFLIAVSQRFKGKNLRRGLLVAAGILLIGAVVAVVSLPVL